jgi:hypothetical protein
MQSLHEWHDGCGITPHHSHSPCLVERLRRVDGERVSERTRTWVDIGVSAHWSQWQSLHEWHGCDIAPDHLGSPQIRSAVPRYGVGTCLRGTDSGSGSCLERTHRRHRLTADCQEISSRLTCGLCYCTVWHRSIDHCHFSKKVVGRDEKREDGSATAAQACVWLYQPDSMADCTDLSRRQDLLEGSVPSLAPFLSFLKNFGAFLPMTPHVSWDFNDQSCLWHPLT